MRSVVREVYRNRRTYADRIFCSEDTFAIADGMGKGRGAVLAAERVVEMVSRERPFRTLDEMYRFF